MAAAGKISTDHNINNVYGSRSLEDGALYLVEERLKTFEDSSWPFDSGPCTGLKVCCLSLVAHECLSFLDCRGWVLLLWNFPDTRLGSMCCMSP